MDLELSRDRFSGLDAVQPPREVEVELKNGVKGTIAIPHSVDDEDFLKSGYAPPTNKMALILHGQGGHRNYCYQKHLAHKMAAELGYYSFRIDFRGCGSSAEIDDPKVGRILESDVVDIQAAAEYVLDRVNDLGQKFVLSAIVAHSRGSVAMFLWAIQQHRLSLDSQKASQAILVPNLINCSSRFRSETVLDRYHIFDWDVDYIEQKALRYGKVQNVKITLRELQSLAEADLSPIKELDPYWSVLSIYGVNDQIIPKEDCAFFANALNRGPYTHHLEIIDHADHNFYGVEAVEHESDQEDLNPRGLPLNKKKLVNYNPVASAIIIKYLRSDQELLRFNARSLNIGSVNRWKTVGGISNFRDLGGWPVYSPTFDIFGDKQLYVRPNLYFRCANTAAINKQGMSKLQRLKITTLFDLRSDQECQKDGVPENLGSIGVSRVHNPVFKNEDYSPQAIALRFSNLTKSWHTYVDAYDLMLENGFESFRTMFAWIRDNPNKAMAFHCAAGKDRTGVFAMLVLLLAGVDDFTIAKEYELTTYGLRPDHEKIKQIFMSGLAKMKDATSMEFLNDLVAMGREGWTLEKEGFDNLLSSRSEAMLATIDLLNTKYGGILNYMEKYLKFSHSEVKAIFENIVCDASPGSLLNKDFGSPAAKF